MSGSGRQRAAWVLLIGGAVALAATWAAAASLPVTPQRLTAYRSCVLSAFPNSTAVVIDAWVQEDTPTTNRGRTTELVVRPNAGLRRRIYVRFDLSKCNPVLPPSATIRAAQLRLRAFIVPSIDSSYALRPVTSPCPQGLATCWGEATINWNNQPGVAVAATDTATICAAASCNNKYYAWDVTADVAAFMSGATPNYGWQLRDAAEGTGNTLARLRPRERNVASEDPVLVIVYT